MMAQRDEIIAEELLHRISWFIYLRWVAVLGVSGTILFARHAIGVIAPLPQLFTVVACIAIYNAIFHAGLVHPRLFKWCWFFEKLDFHTKAAALANTQIVLDLLMLNLLLHFSGGVENPFAFYFIFHMVISAILLSVRASYGQATFASAIFAGTVLAEHFRLIPHYHLNPLPMLCDEPIFVFGVCTAFITTLFITVYMTTSISGKLRAREREVVSLANALQQKTNQLSEAYQKLSELERMKSKHMRKMSHELRTPLNAVESLLAVLEQGLAGELPEKAKELTARASFRVKEMLGIVDDMLALSRIREARLKPIRQDVNIHEIAEKVISAFQPQAELKGINLILHSSGNLPTIQADPDSISELLSNLVSNAIRYTPEGGKVWVRLRPEEENIVIEVADTGIGIEADELENIFDEFYRTRRAKEFALSGTGLGLSIVKAVVENHKGSIKVKSEVGKGTTFTVTLPVIGKVGAQASNLKSLSEGRLANP